MPEPDGPVKISFSDVIGPLHCTMGFAHGYKPHVPVNTYQTTRELLKKWPSSSKALKRILSDYRKGVEWMQGTRFALSGKTQSQHPPRAMNGYWTKNGTIGHVRLETDAGTPVHASFEVPFLRKTSGIYESVWIYDKQTPMGSGEWSDFITRCSYQQGLFQRMTGEALYIRLLAPATRVEEQIQTPSSRPSDLVTLAELLSSATLPTAGHWCNKSIVDNRSGPSRTYRCPLREGQCETAEKTFDD